MTPVKFKQVNKIFGSDYYPPLPAHSDEHGICTSCWEMTVRERIKFLFTGKVWFQLITASTSHPPIKLTADKPELQ